MKIRKAIKSDSVKDFSSLFFSNIVQKFFGLVREIVIAAVFSSSLIYAHFLMLQSVTGIFSQFTSGNSMRANLLPRITKIIEKFGKISLHETDRTLKPIMFWIFVIMQIVQTIVIFTLDSEYSNYLFPISFLLSAIVCFNFYNSIYLTILQAKGKFIEYSVAAALNEFVVIVFIYPFSLLFSIFGLVFSRLFGYLSIIYFYVIPMQKENNGYNLTLGKDDFNIPTLILGNFANIIIFTSRIVSGSDGGDSITYFAYAIFLLNAILTAVIANVSTLLLKKLSVKKDSKFMLYSLLISVVVGIMLVFGLHWYGQKLVELIFVRGNFEPSDAIETTKYLKELSYSFIFIFIATTFFQPFFSLKVEESNKQRKDMSKIFISTIIFSIVFALTQDYGVELESLIVIYTCSVVSLVLSIYSYVFYLKKE
tara:strand:+ start:659 stop:1927 length:1269 start_codon:yes stop_codon:yes gene_type:complete